MDIAILFEDDDILVINKPPGIVVNRAQSVTTETIQDWAEKKLQIECKEGESWGDSFESRAGIVHRIDKETSGILVIAKTPQAFEFLQKEFKDRVIKKTYLAIVHGDVVPRAGEIRAPVGRLPWNREHFGIVPGGKDAVTRYSVIGSSFITHGEKVSVLSLAPETGRTHQIRVHLKYINHPIVGDYLYAGRKTSRNDRVWAPRVMLHAWKMTLTHPITALPLAIEAPIPDDMDSIIRKSTNTTNLQMNEKLT
ncbi:MAG TPA: RluA family pseudouridine synthase [Patescibacteria group bacterium]|nr:RluA family pseudouridine synthase [Patescibacteria group bacterium]